MLKWDEDTSGPHQLGLKKYQRRFKSEGLQGRDGKRFGTPEGTAELPREERLAPIHHIVFGGELFFPLLSRVELEFAIVSCIMATAVTAVEVVEVFS